MVILRRPEYHRVLVSPLKSFNLSSHLICVCFEVLVNNMQNRICNNAHSLFLIGGIELHITKSNILSINGGDQERKSGTEGMYPTVLTIYIC